MPKSPKLTPTTNDRFNEAFANKGNGTIPQGRPYITEAHEPLSTGERPPQLAAAAAPSGPVHIQTEPIAPPQPLKIALIGTAPSSRMLAPYKDPAWKIWGSSAGNMNVLPRFDAWFEVHGNLLWEEHKHYGEPYIEWMKKLTQPLFMQSQFWCPNAKRFPYRELVAEFGGDFFTSTFAWMMAFAIMQRPAEIALYGIDMASRDEYIIQRPGFYYFKRMAEMRGIKVYAPTESDIMQPPGLYAYSDVTPFGRKLYARRKEINERVAHMEQQMQALRDNINYLKGAAEDNDYTISIWMGAQDNVNPLMTDNAAYYEAITQPLPPLQLPHPVAAVQPVTLADINQMAGAPREAIPVQVQMAGELPNPPPVPIKKSRRKEARA